MRRIASWITVVVAALSTTVTAFGQAPDDAIPVTPDNFARAETDMYFDMFAKQGGFGKFAHLRDLPLENTGVRPNRDTLYSLAVFDLDVGSVTITLPDAGKRFMSLLIIDEDHYALGVSYGGGATPSAKTRWGHDTHLRRCAHLWTPPIRRTWIAHVPCKTQ